MGFGDHVTNEECIRHLFASYKKEKHVVYILSQSKRPKKLYTKISWAEGLTNLRAPTYS